jgi:hypothetical protein
MATAKLSAKSIINSCPHVFKVPRQCRFERHSMFADWFSSNDVFALTFFPSRQTAHSFRETEAIGRQGGVGLGGVEWWVGGTLVRSLRC